MTSTVGAHTSTAPRPLEGPAPRFATPAGDNPNDGAAIELVAAALGRPLMPWQRYVAHVATERNADGSFVYPVVVVTVPRQSGKTLLLGAVLLERCIRNAGHAAFYTAQTGKDARARWNDLVKLVAGSPLRRHARARRSQGSERLELPNGSTLQVFAPTADSLHGYTPPTVVLDEAFAHDPITGENLMAAIGPAQITLRDRQLWIVSTRGHAGSTFLEGWIERGLSGAPGVALFDWGAGDNHDPYDAGDLLEFHPALVPDGNDITVESILAEGDRMSRSEYERAYANRVALTETFTIDPQRWRDLGSNQEPPATGVPLALTYDVAYDRLSSSITAVWTDAAGKPQGRMVRWDSGTSWVAPAILDYCSRWNVAVVAADDTGPAREVTDELRNTPAARATVVARNVRSLTSRELTIAWGDLLEAIRTGAFGHDGSDHLANAAAAVVPRPVLDAAAPSRRASPGDISPLVALMVGLFVTRRHDDTPQRPVIRVPGETR